MILAFPILGLLLADLLDLYTSEGVARPTVELGFQICLIVVLSSARLTFHLPLSGHSLLVSYFIFRRLLLRPASRVQSAIELWLAAGVFAAIAYPKLAWWSDPVTLLAGVVLGALLAMFSRWMAGHLARAGRGEPLTGSLESRARKALMNLKGEVRSLADADLRFLQSSAEFSVEGLLAVLEDSSAALSLRCAAAWLLGQVEEQSAGGALANLVAREQQDALVWEAAKALCRLGHSIEIFIRLLADGEGVERRCAAAYALGCLGEPSAVPSLVAALLNRDEHDRVRAHAAEALGHQGDRSVVEPLLSVLKESSSEIRFWSAFALGRLRDPRALPDLEHLAQTDHRFVEGWWEVSREAEAAIEEIRTS
jgi:HEAT repeat protein